MSSLDSLFHADVAEATKAQLPVVAWRTRRMVKSIVGDDRSLSRRLSLGTENSLDTK